MGSEPQAITVRCHCGAVEYRSSGPIFRQGTCTCRACQRATGSLASPHVGVKPDTFEIMRGTPTEFSAQGNEGCDVGTWNFCSNCGAPLFWRAPRDEEIAIFVGALDDPSLFDETKE